MVATLAGSIIAGVMANSLGSRPVLGVSASVMIAGALWIALSPVRSIRDVPAEIIDASTDSPARTAVL
jgi:MFS family permease